MKFIQLTDTHLRKDDTTSDMEHIFKQLPNPANHLRKVLRETPWEDKDFVVITGDLIHEGCSQDYAYLKEILDNELPKDIPILYTLGNHDHKEAFYEGIFQEKCSKPYYYTQECSGFRLVVLDSAIPQKESGTLCQEQLRWLKELLKTKAPKGTLIFIHHPIFWNENESMPMALTNGDEVMEILSGSDVAAIFCGHTHANSIQFSHGIVQCTCDSAAFSISVTKDGILQFTDKSGYADVFIEDADTLSVHHDIIGKQHVALSVPLNDFAKQLAHMDAQEQ